MSKRAFTLLISITLLVLGYVHEQVSILQVSYAIEKKEKELAKLGEEYKLIKFQMARMYSPVYLNQQMKTRSLNLTAPKAIQVIKLVQPRELELPLNQPATIKSGGVSSWMGGWIREAQAKTSNK